MGAFVRRLLAFLLLGLIFQVNADQGAFKDIKVHQNWRSGVFYYNNVFTPRIVNLQVVNTDATVGLFIDFYDSYYITEVMVSKDEQNKGSVRFADGIDMPCAARVDEKSLFKLNCNLTDDNTTFHITMASGLNKEFLEECMKGKTLRIKVDYPETTLYFSFDLNGFSAALNRALSFSVNENESYFKNPKSPSKPKSDASYFDI